MSENDAKRDLYAELGVSRTASQEEITRVYRELAQKLHPDKPTGDGERFARINAAYQILSDPGRRALYDETGDATQAKPIDEEALETLKQLAKHHLACAPIGASIIDMMRLQIEAKCSAIKEQIVKLKKERQRVEWHRKQLRTKKKTGGGTALLDVVYKEAIESIDTGIVQHKRGSVLGRTMLELLEDFDSAPAMLSGPHVTTVHVTQDGHWINLGDFHYGGPDSEG